MWQISLLFILIQKILWLLPDGVVDLLSTEAVKQETLRYQLTCILISHGYEFISLPMIEYTESLLGYASEDVKLQTFKIIDQLTGRLMGCAQISPPQIARIDARLHNNQDTSNPSKINFPLLLCRACNLYHAKGAYLVAYPATVGR